VVVEYTIVQLLRQPVLGDLAFQVQLAVTLDGELRRLLAALHYPPIANLGAPSLVEKARGWPSAGQ
jgi:hypothetical protein